jgi:hypothetical protein
MHINIVDVNRHQSLISLDKDKFRKIMDLEFASSHYEHYEDRLTTTKLLLQVKKERHYTV